MPNETQANDLRKIIDDVKEHLSYLNELGVERIDAPVLVRKSDSAKRASSSVLKSAITNPEPTETVSMARPIDDMKKASKRRPTELSSPDESLFGAGALESEPDIKLSGDTLEKVWGETRDCTRCPLWEGRTHVVNSEGNRRAQLMFVGEAPGADEDAQARPFVGRAGQLLNKIIESIGLKREDVFIGNVNRCRPPQNRTPTLVEGVTCKPFIIREIDIVKPRVVVVLGNVAMKNLLDTKEGITKLRGKFQDYRGIKVMPTFHPAYLLRDPSKKRETWEDMKTVRDYLSVNQL